MSKQFRPCVVMVFMLLALLIAASAFAAPRNGIRVLVLPFAVNSGDDLSYLEDGLPDLIGERLAAKNFSIVPDDEVERILAENAVTELNISIVRDLCLLSNSDYAVYGSFTQVGEQLSIDARLVEAYGLQPAKPIYINKSGLINVLPAVDELVAQATNEMLRKQSISNIVVKGTKILDPDVVLLRMRIQKGDALDSKKINEEIKRIYGLGFFSDVQVSVEKKRDGNELVITVVEKPKINNIIISGSDAVDSDDILAAISSKQGAILNEKLLSDDIARVRDLYRKEGYYLAEVDYKIERGTTGATLTFNVKEGEKLYIKDIQLEGVEKLDADDVKSELALSERGMFSWLTGSGVLREDYLERDVAAIAAYYLNRGFLDVRVGNARVDYEEDGIVITFPVSEGERYKLGTITFTGDLIEPDETYLSIIGLDEWKEDEEYLNYTVLREDSTKIGDWYANYGYAYADVDFGIQRAEDHIANVSYKINKKNKVYVRRVVVEGNTRTRDNVVRRAVELTDGELFNGDKLRDSNRTLNNLGYFSEASVNIVPTQSPEEVDLKVKVKEKNTGSIMAGVGWSSYDGVGFSGSIKEDNLWGKGYRLALTASFSSKKTSYDLSFLNPSVYDSDLSFSARTYITETEYDDYDYNKTGAKISFGYPVGKWSRVYAGYRFDQYQITDVDDDADNLIKEQADEGTRYASVLHAAFSRNTIDNFQRPTAGNVVNLTVNYGGSFLQGTDDFIKVVGEARQYYALNNDHVLMARAKAAALLPNGGSQSDIPIVERFWVGGINSVRGYDINDFAVRENDGDKIGGTRMAFANFEYQWYFENELGMTIVPFFDVGTNFDDKDDDGLTSNKDWLYSTGLELRWRSPMGDLRFAYGVPLADVNGERQSPRFEFAMGQAF
ncbi:outer membrane protein assembly factor BamA [Halodesulfovibrio aestuarii]|uniref:Outer membrane protein assembly factor BamA n=1 Tax=Halodesulfovibrio aestuarii TaxID=126333 RepID=A0A8G2CC42_9BACT|nr:outer membrane protein assembly factor BamA [Halodesulfovibrio aestuarii]SHJ49382.1 Beta-barrel assembly machine subunit BamA [Halodesulfovibrio aestuarii]